MSRILVVDDEPAICWSFEQALTENGHSVTSASTAEAALALADRFDPELVLLDFRLPGMDGLSVLRQLRSKRPRTPVILMTAYGSLDLAVDALGQGAFDYLPKPFELNDAVDIVSRALNNRTASADIQTTLGSTIPSEQEIVGTSRGIQEVFRQIALVAQLDVPVLITGESGVGKELVARAIHRYSGRHAEKFVPICVPALSDSVLESELFGHVRGAFTGAERERPGLLTSAHLGTAFFDEIGDIPLPQQVKLLRVLEERQVTPVGGDQSQPATFRLIAATHRPLGVMVASGTFREDLYYRLNVFSIHVPPLRDRPEDIPLLARRFLTQISAGRPLTFTSEALLELQRRPWRGNVRELRSAVQHAAVVCRGTLINADCLPESPLDPVPPQGTFDDRQFLSQLEIWARDRLKTVDQQRPETLLYEQFLNAFEPTLFTAALDAAAGNRKAAADILGLHRETLRKRLRKHQLGEAEPE